METAPVGVVALAVRARPWVRVELTEQQPRPGVPSSGSVPGNSGAEDAYVRRRGQELEQARRCSDPRSNSSDEDIFWENKASFASSFAGWCLEHG